MRIVDALKARNQLTPVYDPASEEQRQARRERQAAQHARAVIAMMDEIPRRELDFEALGGRVIEHVASADGDYYRPFGGDPPFTGDDVTKYFVAQDGTPRCWSAAQTRPAAPNSNRCRPGSSSAASSGRPRRSSAVTQLRRPAARDADGACAGSRSLSTTTCGTTPRGSGPARELFWPRALSSGPTEPGGGGGTHRPHQGWDQDIGRVLDAMRVR